MRQLAKRLAELERGGRNPSGGPAIWIAAHQDETLDEAKARLGYVGDSRPLLVWTGVPRATEAVL